MPLQPPDTASNPLIRLAFYGMAIGMALLHVFITFKGLSSADGMEQAQIAREFARGHGWETKVIRPYAWALLEDAGKPAPLKAMPEITQPPVQPLIWGAAFKFLPNQLVYVPGKGGSIFILDRVIACLGVSGLLLTLLWTHGTARKLFDDTVAHISVLALLLCEPLWELSVSGSPVALLLPLTALAIRLLTAATLSAQEGSSPGKALFALGLVAALMVFTHWLAVWLVVGLALGAILALPGKRGQAALSVLALPLLALGGWGWWMMQRCSDPLGGAKTLFQTHLLPLDVTLLQRQFAAIMPPVSVADLPRKLVSNWLLQFGDLYTLLGCSVPALFFLVALMHRFRRPETASLRLSVGMILLAVTLGMGFIGLPRNRVDDNNLYAVLIPAMTVFGSAMLAVLWSRLYPMASSLWTRWGFAILAVMITALPLLNTVPAQVKLGLTLQNRIYPHWPPYVPDRVSVVRRLVEPDEVLFSDAPWFVAWYADTPTVWIPVKRDDYARMKPLIEAQQNRIAGFIMTPLSSRLEYLHEAFTGPYSEWPDLLFRGPMLALDREFPARADFEFKMPVPLVAVPVGARESLSLHMTFYTDRARTLKP